MLPLHRMILETVAYADVFDYPLTEFEVWQLLLASDGEGERVGAVSYRSVLEALDGSFLSRRLGRDKGFVFVRGREALVARRVRFGKRADRNILRARRIARVLRYLPFVRMVGLTGSLSMKNAGRGSDTDFFIVLEAGRIWTGRAIATLALHLLGLRRHGRHIARRACLNFWVTTESLEIRLKDIFSSSEYSFLIPLFDDGVFAKFQEANAWIRRFRPNFESNHASYRYQISNTFFSKRLRKFLEGCFSSPRLESVLRSVQQKKIAANPKTKTPEGIIETNDDRLVFLPSPRGPKVFEEFFRRISDIETAAMR